MNGKKVISNMIWRFAERSSAQIVTFLVSIVLARILDPSVYGTVALVTVFTSILQIFIDSGLGNSLIQKKDADNIDFSTVFYTNILFCLLIYLVMFVCAPFIAKFYGNNDMTLMLRVLSITVIIAGVKNIQQAYVARNLLFRKFFYSTIGGTIFSAFVGIGMAILGCGPWALIFQHLSNTLVDTVILWVTVKWRPKKSFSFSRIKILFTYGWKLLASALLDGIYNNLTSLIVGKKYSSKDLAYYNQGQKFPIIIVTNIITSIDSVLLPVMSNEQDNNYNIKMITRKSLRIGTFIMAPLMIGLSACGNNLINLILGEKWIDSVIFLQIFCFTYLFWPVHTTNLNAIKALGRSDLFLKLELIKKLIGVILICISMNIGVVAIAISMLINSLLALIINAFPNKKLLDYGYLEQIKDIGPSIIISLIIGIIVWAIGCYIQISCAIELFIQVVVGALSYIILAKIFKIVEMEYLFNIIRKRKKSCG